MLTKLREILLTQYIGSILVALLVWQATFEFVTTMVRTAFWSYNNRNAGSVLRPSSVKFPWDNMVFSGVTICLYLLAAYALARWLFPDAFASTTAASRDEPDDNEVNP